MGKVLMVQGTSSGVGKSLITTALCRYFKRKGLKVAPFKSQNMSLNSAVSIEGGEMARSQYIQAMASDENPSVKMNPILLKPETNGSQIILMGKPYAHMNAKDYMYSKKVEFFMIAKDALEDLIDSHDIVVVEGAGSPVEINLKDHDIVNMSIAKSVKAPVLLVADIEKGGAFAQIAGTMELFDGDEKNLVIGYIFNKFIGDRSLLGDYPQMLAQKYEMKYFGTMPFIYHKIPEEDSMIDWTRHGSGDLKVKILKLPHISNFDDFDPLFWNTDAEFVTEGNIDADILIIPGTKMTSDDLEWLRKNGFDEQIKKMASSGTYIVGICGGYQMLGDELVEGTKKIKGLKLLHVRTVFEEKKTLSIFKGRENLFGNKVEGYEIHHGISYRSACTKPFAIVEEKNGQKVDQEDGAMDRNVLGTYFHGIFQNLKFTKDFLNAVRKSKGMEEKEVESSSLMTEIDRFTDIFESNINVEKIEELL